MKKILILGASGTIGSAIFRCASKQYQCWGTYNKNKPTDLDSRRIVQWDIQDINTLSHLFADISPDVVISSLTGDFETQISAHKHIAESLSDMNTHMIFISTANVFDGETDKPHAELDKPHPVSKYGKFKLECEKMLQSMLDERCLIVRIPKVMTREVANNFVFGKPVYRNLYASFNTSQNIAEAITECIRIQKQGVLHLSSDDFMSADMACTLMGKSGYAVEDLTLNTYAGMMGCALADVKVSADGKFYFALQSVDNISERFAISCQDIMKKLN